MSHCDILLLVTYASSKSIYRNFCRVINISTNFGIRNTFYFSFDGIGYSIYFNTFLVTSFFFNTFSQQVFLYYFMYSFFIFLSSSEIFYLYIFHIDLLFFMCFTHVLLSVPSMFSFFLSSSCRYFLMSMTAIVCKLFLFSSKYRAHFSRHFSLFPHGTFVSKS